MPLVRERESKGCTPPQARSTPGGAAGYLAVLPRARWLERRRALQPEGLGRDRHSVWRDIDGPRAEERQLRPLRGRISLPLVEGVRLPADRYPQRQRAFHQRLRRQGRLCLQRERRPLADCARDFAETFVAEQRRSRASNPCDGRQLENHEGRHRDHRWPEN